MMPFFNETGRPYKEKLEAATTAVKLVSEMTETVDAHHNLVRRARIIAAARGEHQAGHIPDENFRRLWDAEWKFVSFARRELNLPAITREAVASLELWYSQDST
jgi:hypothetical protein